MTDQTNSPPIPKEENKQPEDVLGDVRESLIEAEEENEQPKDVLGDVRQALIEAEEEKEKAPQRKNIFQVVKNIQSTKFFKKKDKKTGDSFSDDVISNELSSIPDDDVISARLFSEEDESMENEKDGEPEIASDLLEEKLDEEFADEASDEDIDPKESNIHIEEDIEEEEEKEEPEGIELEIESEESDTPKPKLTVASEKDLDKIRGVALEEYTDEPVVEINERREAWRGFFQTPIGQMRLLERLVLAILILASAGILIWMGIESSGGLQLSTARPTNTPDPNVPVPINVKLPGGWSFNLKKGHLDAEGEWNPFGAEWLVGTEICRWVALPWSTQLEAVIRTLEVDDPIEVKMSNLDVLTYHVQSRQEVGETQTEGLNLDIPSLLIILAEEDSDQKWVLTAVLSPED